MSSASDWKARWFSIDAASASKSVPAFRSIQSRTISTPALAETGTGWSIRCLAQQQRQRGLQRHLLDTGGA